jgi:hypothetical protein
LLADLASAGRLWCPTSRSQDTTDLCLRLVTYPSPTHRHISSHHAVLSHLPASQLRLHCSAVAFSTASSHRRPASLRIQFCRARRFSLSRRHAQHPAISPSRRPSSSSLAPVHWVLRIGRVHRRRAYSGCSADVQAAFGSAGSQTSPCARCLRPLLLTVDQLAHNLLKTLASPSRRIILCAWIRFHASVHSIDLTLTASSGLVKRQRGAARYHIAEGIWGAESKGW